MDHTTALERRSGKRDITEELHVAVYVDPQGQ